MFFFVPHILAYIQDSLNNDSTNVAINKTQAHDKVNIN